MKYYVDRRALIEAAVLPSEGYFLSVIRENNESSVVYIDPATDRIYVECENKPRDMPLFGIRWKEE